MNRNFEREYEIRWSELDPNGHMRHSAYLDYGAQLRLAFLAAQGLTMARMGQLGIGPVLFREEIRYQAEIRGGETIRVSLELSGVSRNRKHWRMRHHIRKADGSEAAVIEVQGAWLDLRARRITLPPEEITGLIEVMPHAEDFEEFESGAAK
jgi:acyl-CoA thioester hydrolase